MMLTVASLPAITFIVVVLSWITFVLAFVLRKTQPRSTDRKRDPVSITGLILQGLSYAVVWAWHRPYLTPLFAAGRSIDVVVAVFAIAVTITAVLITMMAVKALGKEWSLTARVVEGHKLATNGPYAFVRHPIYTGMLGMLLGTALAVSRPLAIPVALLVFSAGTFIRVRSEEKLLRDTFGPYYDDYARRVAAIVPGIL